MGKLLWEPSAETIAAANITRFTKIVNENHGTTLRTYDDLYQWSIKDVASFWAEVWQFAEIKASVPYTQVVTDQAAFPPTTKWFSGASLNFAENLLRFRDDHPAILFKAESLETKTLSYAQLYREVAQVVKALKQVGIQPGDRVAGYMPNVPQTVIAMLAATALGATWSSCGAELGAEAALDRLGQIEPRVLFAVDGYWYKGKVFEHLPKLEQVISGIPSLEKVVIWPYTGSGEGIDNLPNAVWWDDFIIADGGEIEFRQCPADQPLYIMFSSGTTGKPKCMVQGVAGVLLNHLKELQLHTDMKRDDKLLYLASPSWMMWNWLVTGLATGGTIVLFDGNPLYPDWTALWKFMADEGVTIFGCSASYLHHLQAIEARPGKEFDLRTLREISQTGSALSPAGFDFVYTEIKEDLHFNSISGGTDINGCFTAGSPTLPVYSGELQARALGMRVEAYDNDGNPLYDEQGELVCETPSPSMPLYFWNDPDNKRYSAAYFDYFTDKHVWRHGDYIVVHKQTGGVTFYGRSDATLKPSGVRIGTSEIYNIVEHLPEIMDSLAIGQSWQADQRILLFVQMQGDQALTPELEAKIRTELRTKASPRHVPQLIFQTPDIPYTFSGKKVESAVTNIIHGRAVTNRGALRNPTALDFFSEILAKLE